MLEQSKYLQDLTFRLDDAISRQKETATIDGEEILLSALAFKLYLINLEFGREDLARAYLKEQLRLEKIEQKNEEERDRLKFLSLCEKLKDMLNEYMGMRGHSNGHFTFHRSINTARQEQVAFILKTIEELKSHTNHKRAASILQNVLLSVRAKIQEEYVFRYTLFGRQSSALGHLIQQTLEANFEQSTDTLKLSIK